MEMRLVRRVGTSFVVATCTSDESEFPMRTFICLIPILFGLNIVVAACDEGGRQPSTKTTQKSSTPPSRARLSDSELQKAVRAKLESDAQLKDADISVIAIGERNEITLSGTVRSRAARDKAIELAKSAKPGVLVNDQIDVKPGA
jgi:osmotically-inducible protein OsmY